MDQCTCALQMHTTHVLYTRTPHMRLPGTMLCISWMMRHTALCQSCSETASPDFARCQPPHVVATCRLAALARQGLTGLWRTPDGPGHQPQPEPP